MRLKSLSLCTLLTVSMPSSAQLSAGIGVPGVSIGFDLGAYPDLIPILGYAVYYALFCGISLGALRWTVLIHSATNTKLSREDLKSDLRDR